MTTAEPLRYHFSLSSPETKLPPPAVAVPKHLELAAHSRLQLLDEDAGDGLGVGPERAGGQDIEALALDEVDLRALGVRAQREAVAHRLAEQLVLAVGELAAEEDGLRRALVVGHVEELWDAGQSGLEVGADVDGWVFGRRVSLLLFVVCWLETRK